MSQARFGEHLARLVKLSVHDVNEILEEQAATRHRFGEIALSWGLCQPEHVWQAWSDQLSTTIGTVDLEKLGIDSQAAAMSAREVAVRLKAIPLRCMGRQLIVAVSDPDTARIAAELFVLTGKDPRFVLSDLHKLQAAMTAYYPQPAAA